jgi:D-3-phosphoglycerate dehydrogenase
LVVRSRTKATADIINAGEKLKVIGRAGAGVDNIDVAAATAKKVVVMNTPGGNTIAAAEHTIAMLLSALRNIPRAYKAMLEGRWDKKLYTGNEIFGKTIGVVGVGKIGAEVVKRLKAFEAKIIIYDPFVDAAAASKMGAEKVELEALMKRSDIITIHAPKMPETIDLINKDNLQLCKDGVVIVNCARGGIINEKDLLDALNSGKVGKAAIDVYTKEPLEDYTLAQHEKVTAAPHLGASTEEAQIKVADLILDQMIDYMKNGNIRNTVNKI